jgi:replicative DNA helicase
LANLFFATRPRDPEYYHTVFETLEKQDASAETTFKLLLSIQTSKLLRELSLDAYDCAEGRSDLAKVKDKISSLQQLLESEKDNEATSDFEFVTDDLDILVNDSIKTVGLRWRLHTLNHMLGSLRGGDFGFVFARPETGKTTFLASEATFMAQQIPEGKGPILWLNNEQEGKKVMLRCYQAALNLTMTDLFRDMEGNKKRYHELTKGNIKLYDSASIHRRSVEKLCVQLKPSLIIFDQIDKIVGFDNDREDLRLGTIYQWARELAKSYAPVIGICQADGSGEGQKWLTMSNVANSKTAKQAEADWILGIGKVNESGYDQLRYLHLSKNKLLGDEDSVPDLRHGRRECLIDAERGRYTDIG